MITKTLQIPRAEFEQATGWEVKPEGACKGEMCVPLPDGAASGDVINLSLVAERLGMPVLHDESASAYCVGPESVGGRALTTAVAPELVLPTIDGDEFRLSSLRGQKVVLAAWAPY